MADENAIERITIEVSTHVDDGASALSKLKNNLQKIQQLVQGVGNLNGSGPENIKGLAGSLGVLAEAGGTKEFGLAVSRLNRLSKIDWSNLSNSSSKVNELADSVTRLSDRVKEHLNFKDMYRIGRESGATSGIPKGSSEATTQTVDQWVRQTAEVTQQTQTMNASLGSTQTALQAVGSYVSPAITAISAIGNVVGKVGKTVWEYTGKKLTQRISDIVGRIKHIGATIKRIVLYRMIRSAMSEISKGFTEGLKNLYTWSDGVGGRFASSMDKMTTALTYFKNSVAAAVSPLLNAFAPALDVIIDKIVEVINTINQFFASLTGASSWTKAIRVQQKYTEATKSGSKAAKEYKNTLMGFDELNLLNAVPNSGSGGGAGGADASKMFEEVPLAETWYTKLAEKIREKWEEKDFLGVGTLLGHGFNHLIETSPWDEWGSKLGEKIQGVISVAFGFFTTANFENLGLSIATFFNNLFGEIDADMAGRDVSLWVTSMLDMIIGFIHGADFGLYGEKMGDFIRGLLDEGIKWLKSHNWDEEGKTFGDKIADFITGMKVAETVTKIEEFLGEVMGDVGDFISGIEWDTLSESLVDGLVVGHAQGGSSLKVGWQKFLKAVANALVKGLWGAIRAAWKGITGGSWITALLTGGQNAAWNNPETFGYEKKTYKKKDWFGEEYTVEELVPSKTQAQKEIESFFEGLQIALTKGAGSLATRFGQIGKTIWDTFMNPIRLLKKDSGDEWDKVRYVLVEKAGELHTKIKEKLDPIRTVLADILSKMKIIALERIEGIKTDITTGIEGLKKKVVTAIEGILKKAKEIWNQIKGSFDLTIFPKIKLPVLSFQGLLDFVTGSVPSLTVSLWKTFQAYAQGGFPDMGEMFIAREAGPEMVGTIGNRTAVVNNDDIVAAVSEGVAQAVASVMGSSNGSTVVNFNVDGKTFYQQVVSANHNEIRRTGINPMLA